jgi:hypothetical protein
MKNIGDYADLPGVIFDRLDSGRLWRANFADILRLNLLKNHGGIWADATDYFTAPIPEWVDAQPFFMFHATECGSPYSFIQNCFIKSDKDSLLLRAWYQMMIEYWTREDCRIDYFQHQLMFKGLVFGDDRANALYKKMPNKSQEPTHRLAGRKLFAPFDQAEFDAMRRESFFQKLNRRAADEIPADSYYRRLIDMAKE